MFKRYYTALFAVILMGIAGGASSYVPYIVTTTIEVLASLSFAAWLTSEVIHMNNKNNNSAPVQTYITASTAVVSSTAQILRLIPQMQPSECMDRDQAQKVCTAVISSLYAFMWFVNIIYLNNKKVPAHKLVLKMFDADALESLEKSMEKSVGRGIDRHICENLINFDDHDDYHMQMDSPRSRQRQAVRQDDHQDDAQHDVFHYSSDFVDIEANGGKNHNDNENSLLIPKEEIVDKRSYAAGMF